MIYSLIGYYSLILGLIIGLLLFYFSFKNFNNSNILDIKIVSFTFLQLFFVVISFLCLIASFVVSDFSNETVFNNSHTTKPLFYKISGTWGNHEGSLLLWVIILIIFSFLFLVFTKNHPKQYRIFTLIIQNILIVGFLFFILFNSNPFAILSPVPREGLGLNPILQDPALVIHPPLLYIGFVGSSIYFSAAMASLITNYSQTSFVHSIKNWVLISWCFQTLGILVGSIWAYYELGWGGFWFWDPVENASLLPWFAMTALLHSLIVFEKRGLFYFWVITLCLLTFILSVTGTFLVRSGILNSVHSFATDPGRGIFILIFLIIVIGGSLILYSLRAPQLKSGGIFSPISREASLVINNLLLMSATAAVLIGTLYPLILDAVSGEKVSVGPPFYTATFIPIMTPLIIVMGIAPMISWKRADLAGVLSRFWFCIAVTVTVAVITLYFTFNGPVLAGLCMALAVWLIAGALSDLAARVKLFKGSISDTIKRILNYPRSALGGSIAHAGVGVLVLGITLSSSFEIEKIQSMSPGDKVDVGNFTFKFNGTELYKGPNYDAIRGRFEVFKGNELIFEMAPENRSFSKPEMITTEAAIKPRNLGDLYAVLGEENQNNSFATRLYYKPMINCLWIGCVLMALGGFVSLSDRKYRIGAPKKNKLLKKNKEQYS